MFVQYSTVLSTYLPSTNVCTFVCLSNVCQDLGLREHALSLLMSIHPVWLRLGLETVYGETIEIASERGMRPALRRFLLTRFVADPEISAAYKDTRHGVFGERYFRYV